MDLRNVVWPMRARAEPNGVQRLARVLHWAFVGLGALCLLAVASDIGFAAAAVGLAIFGRALRYIMAGE